jgi:flagellar basal body rod protein FlgG
MNIGLYQSAASLSALEKWQDTVSQNITASQTAGFRKRTVQFSSEAAGLWNLRPDAKVTGPEDQQPVLFTRVTSGISFLTGETQPTRREFDVAIQGEGFFELQAPDGATFFTRNGEFRVTPDRTLVGAGGFAVMTEGGAPLTLLPGGGPVSINRDGTVFQGATALGKLSVQKFANTGALQPAGSGMFRELPGAGREAVDEPELMQGYLEQSNVQPLREMVDLVLISRAYEANQKVISATDDQMDKTLRALG